MNNPANLTPLSLYQFATQPGSINMSPDVWRYPFSNDPTNCSYWIHYKCTTPEQFDMISTKCVLEEELYADENIFRMFLLFVQEATSAS